MSNALALGRFGHHPNPADDFCVEVEEIIAIHKDRELRFPNPDDASLDERVRRAMDFTVGGNEHAVHAKQLLREVARKMEEAEQAVIDIVRNAMRDAWNEICADTGCRPSDLERRGNKTYFTPHHWAALTGAYVARALRTQGIQKAER